MCDRRGLVQRAWLVRLSVEFARRGLARFAVRGWRRMLMRAVIGSRLRRC